MTRLTRLIAGVSGAVIFYAGGTCMIGFSLFLLTGRYGLATAGILSGFALAVVGGAIISQFVRSSPKVSELVEGCA